MIIVAEIKSLFDVYRKRKSKINNIEIEIENLKLNGIDDNTIEIQELLKEINKLKNENKKIDNILTLLPERDCMVVKLVLIDGKDKKNVAKEIDRTPRQVDRILNKAAKKMII